MPVPYLVPYPVPQHDSYTYLQNLPMAIQLIEEAVSGETEVEPPYT